MKKGTRASVSSVLCGNRRVLDPARLERRLGEDAESEVRRGTRTGGNLLSNLKESIGQASIGARKQRVSSDTVNLL